VTCPACGADNRDGARFCGECAAPLVKPVACPSCGTPNPGARKFCDACGTSLAARPTTDAVARKVVTIVFADLIGSTALHERLDPESVSRLMDRYHRAVRVPIEAHGGTVVQLLGDGVMSAFGVPRVAEDDAIRAVRAAVAVQEAFREFAREEQAVLGSVGLRVAVNTGEVVVSDEYAAGIGDPLNVAARLQQEARDGQVLVGEATQRLVGELVTLAPVGTFALKGRAEGVTAYRVVSLERPAGAAATPFVGRDAELRRLVAVHEAAVAAPGARLAVILGSPGLGKSRLLAELSRRVGERSTVLAAHCDAAGSATFAPLAAALRTYLRLDDGADRDSVRAAVGAVVPGEESARIADGIAELLAGTPASPEETFFVVRRLLAAIAATRPVVLAIDDLQWAEPLLLDLTEHLVQWSAGVPLLVLVAARPELRDVRSSLAAPGGLVTDVVTLGGLDAAAATRLAANVVGADALPAAIAGRVLATSEGNPLFVGELVRMLVQDGVLKREGDRWITGVELAALEMPPTIQALLAARIERLRPEERIVLERAAVVGRQFSRTAVAQLLPREVADLDARLESLRRSELIEPDVGWLVGEPVLRFHHVLIRDAAYRRVLKGTRAELHARFADWLEAKVGEAVEHDETLGWHLEQAHQSLRDLGPLDTKGRALGERAARHLAAAGRRALARDDVPVAASLVGRALARLDETDPARADLALDWCEALLASGDVATAATAISELGRFVDGSDRLRGWHTCLAGQHGVLTDPQSLRATVVAVAAAAETLAAAGDPAGEAKAHHVHAMALARLGKVGECEAALDRALAAARRGHDRRRANAVLSGAPLAALWGPSPVTRASGRCLDVVRVLRITQGAPAVEAVALRCQAVLEALRGRTDAARRMLASSRRLVEELGITQRLLEADVAAGQIELYEGDAAAAERSLRAAYEGLRSHGLGIDAAQAAALLGRALLALGRDTDAEALSHESEALAGDDLRAAVAWRGVRAEALARRGDHAAAVELARAGVAIASTTDALLDHADARRALGAALRAAGRTAEADAEDARTIELWEAKGATLLVERTPRADRAAERREPVPVTRPVQARPGRRRVRLNAVAANVARFDAAMAARDAAALAALLRDDHELVDHPNGRTYGRAEVLDYLDPIIRAKGLAFSHELVATLGTSLALCRGSQSVDELAQDDGASFGKSLYEFYIVIEGNADQHWRVEQFADDHLGDAVARLYARYAELLPAGAAQERASATARSVAAVVRRMLDFDSYAAAVAPDIEFVDHQPLGFGTVRGAHGFLRGFRALRDLSEGLAIRFDDVLGLRPDALLVRQTNVGTDRSGGGAFERHFLPLLVFGANGLLTRVEWFAPDREDEALARFDALAAAAPPDVRPPVAPRVRPNGATAAAARLDAAVAARDADAVAAALADDLENVNHPTGTRYGRDGVLFSVRGAIRSQNVVYRHQPLAALGDSLALCSFSISSAGFAGGDLDIGPFEKQEIHLIEVDAQGRRRRAEFFARDRLADAVARLYERYADLLPPGSARDRAAATARSVGVLLCSFDLDRWATVIAADVEFDDRRSLVGFGLMHGAEPVLRAAASYFEVADDVVTSCDQVIAVEPDALLVGWTTSGKARVGGGAYEREVLRLLRFGVDGLMTHGELFDVGREAEALARLDELAAPSADAPSPVRRVRSNAATAATARMAAAAGVLDTDAMLATTTDDLHVVHHPGGIEYGREGVRDSIRLLMNARDPVVRIEPIATLGDSLALVRQSITSAGMVSDVLVDMGVAETEYLPLVEVNAHGLVERAENYARDRLADAVARLYERYADLLPPGSARERAAATARSVGVLLCSFDPDRWAPFVAADVDFADHRSLVGFGSTRGAQAMLRVVATNFEVADDVVVRCDQVIAAEPDALLVRSTIFGKARVGGGAYEREVVRLCRFGPDGLMTHNELFDVGREAKALARFDELARASVPSPAAIRRVRPNAATACAARVDASFAARDAEANAALIAPEAEFVHHPTGLTYDREAAISDLAMFFASHTAVAHEALATLGDSLALCRRSALIGGVREGDFDVGPASVVAIVLLEVDAQGRRFRQEVFAEHALPDAIARLYARYAETVPAGAARERAAATARTVAATTPSDLDRLGAVLAPTAEIIDHRTEGFGSGRGVEWLGRVLATAGEVADDPLYRIDDILAAQPNALVLRLTLTGRVRLGGGAFESPYLRLQVFGTDGLVTRIEVFNVGREREALARLDELAADGELAFGPSATPAGAVRRRVRPNAATAQAASLDVVMAARDADALPALFAEGETVHHPTGLTYDLAGGLRTLRGLLDTEDLQFAHVPLATLGDSLALFRSLVSYSALRARDVDVGAVTVDKVLLIETDDRGRRSRGEWFADDHLGDGIARLYERYAERLPEGPARERAAATARSVAVIVKALEIESAPAVLAPTIEYVDHRRLGFGSVRGVEAFLSGVRSMWELAENLVVRIDDVLALRPDALLCRRTLLGTDRASGGPFEQEGLSLWRFGADGRMTRHERLDVDRADQALARFDELAAGSPARDATADHAPAVRRVRTNAATTNVARTDAAFAARDLGTLADLLADTSEFVHHPTGTTYRGREAGMSQWRKALRNEDPTLRHEALASLGDSLALCRRMGTAGAIPRLDFGAILIDNFVVIEVDGGGRRLCTEIFAENGLGDAVVRLYERYADSLPEGRDRTHAAATARGIAAIVAFDVRRVTERQFAPDIEFVDHRRLGLESSRGADAAARRNRALLELADDFAFRVDDVLGTRPDTVLWRATLSGTDRASGGAFEQPHLDLRVFGADGRQTRTEFFDVDRVDEALARFDALTFEPSPAESALSHRVANNVARRVRPNAATADAARLDAAMAARDLDALAALSADESETIDHPTGTTYDNMGDLASRRMMLKARDLQFHHEPLATLGESLALHRLSISASGVDGGRFDVGAYERELLVLSCGETDTRKRHAELFAVDQLGNAVARLYNRYADTLPDGPARTRAAATARSVATVLGPVDPDRYATAYAPALEAVDHRILGTYSARGAEAMLQHYRSVLELADDVAVRDDEVLALRPDALLTRRTHAGTARAGGGAYERLFLILSVFGTDGLVTRVEFFDVDHEAEALARFDALAAEPAATPVANAKRHGRRVRANTATATAARFDAAMAARDADALPPVFADDFEVVDHKTGATYDREGVLSSLRLRLSAQDPTFADDLLATLGDSLALSRWSMSANGFADGTLDVGPFEVEHIGLTEVDAHGRRRLAELFATDRLGDAVARLYERYAEVLPDGPARDRAAGAARSVTTYTGPYDPDRYAAAWAPDIEVVDRRVLGTHSARGAEAFIEHYRGWLNLADGTAFHDDELLGLEPGAVLWRRTFSGIDRSGGGAFERQFIQLWTFGADGRITRIEYFDADHVDQALARFDELTAAPRTTARIENAATRLVDRFAEAWEARDWERVEGHFASEFRVSDRRTMAHVEVDRTQHLASLRPMFEMTSCRFPSEVLAARGERLVLLRQRFEGSNRDVGPSDVEFLSIVESNERGDGRVALVMLDPDDLDAAYDELDARFAAGEAARHPAMEAVSRGIQAVAARDWEKLASLFTPNFVLDDHRILGWGTLHTGDEYIAAVRALVDLRPDVVMRINHVLALDDRAALLVSVAQGSESEGAFEIPLVVVSQFAPMPDGRIARWDVYDLDDLETARALYLQLRTESPARIESPTTGMLSDPLAVPARPSATAAARYLRPDPLRIPPNAATRASAVLGQCYATEDWERMRALCAPIVWEDRRRLARTIGDVDLVVENARIVASSQPRLSTTTLATAGDRLALQRLDWSGVADGGAWEMEMLEVMEVDSHGRVVAAIEFDADDRRAASLELLERYARSDAARWWPASVIEVTRAIYDHDLDRIRSALPDDFFVHDHRRTGIGRIEGADDYIASIAAVYEQSPDAIPVTLYNLIEAKHGSLNVGGAVGRLTDGGEFELVFVRLLLFQDDRFVGFEMFEPEDLDVARARFEALRPPHARPG
jgi:tetratricopeptide (TPR) repeat protein